MIKKNPSSSSSSHTPARRAALSVLSPNIRQSVMSSRKKTPGRRVSTLKIASSSSKKDMRGKENCVKKVSIKQLDTTPQIRKSSSEFSKAFRKSITKSAVRPSGVRSASSSSCSNVLMNKKITPLRPLMRRTPLIGKPLRVLTPPVAQSSSEESSSIVDVSLNIEDDDFLSCVKDLSEIFNDSDESVVEHEFVLSPTKEQRQVDDSIFEAKCENGKQSDFQDWSRDELVHVLKTTLTKRETLKSAFDVMENAYNRQERNIEAMRVNRIEELRQRVQTANQKVSSLSTTTTTTTTRGITTSANNKNDTNRKKYALLRVAIEKEQIQKQFKELKRKFQEKKDSFHQHHQRKDTKWTQILKNKEMKDNTTTKINFPTLTIDTTDTTKEVLIQLYEMWYELFAYSRAVSLKSTRSPFETKINGWRSTYC